MAVNIVGSLILGAAAALLGIGVCGALTTYSTFGYETIRLLENRACGCAVLNAIASVVASLGAAFVGFAIAQAIWP